MENKRSFKIELIITKAFNCGRDSVPMADVDFYNGILSGVPTNGSNKELNSYFIKYGKLTCAFEFALMQYCKNGIINEEERSILITELLKIDPYKIQDFHSWIDRMYKKFWR